MQAFGDVAQPSSLGRAAQLRVPLLEPRGLRCHRQVFCEVLPSAQQAAGWDQAVPPHFPHPARGSCHGLVSLGGSSCCGFSIGDCPIPYDLLFEGCCKFEAYNFCRASEASALGSFLNTFPAHCCQDAALSERQRPAAIPSRREAPCRETAAAPGLAPVQVQTSPQTWAGAWVTSSLCSAPEQTRAV